MKKLIAALSALLIASCASSYGQERASGSHCSWKTNKHNQRTTVADPAEDNYDVKYLKFNLNMTNASTTLSGDVTTVAKVVSASLPAYVFELDPAYTIDSVLINGTPQTLTTSGVVRTVAISPSLPMGSMFTTQVFYNGTYSGGASFFSGISNMVSPTWGAHVTSTLSESYDANQWWPCKQSLRDKIDSVDMWITVADSLKAGSNGVLQAITPIDTAHSRYEWKERYPIDYYLISAAVAPYVDYSYYAHFTGSTDSVLVQNYVYNNPATLPHFKSIIDSTGMMINYFSTLYGRYPFWQEKYGHCMSPISGGMEHQTMTTLGYFEGTLIAHELGHQWFGDNVTCGSWADIFMNEGFASYTEDLFIDHFRSHTQMLSDIILKQTDVKSFDTGTVYVDDTTDQNRVFDNRLTYEKGASLLHMLRSIINNDSEFFQVYKVYQQQMKDSTGTILDFRNVAANVLGLTVNGINLDSFFNQWAYLQGFPIYNITWNQSGSDVYVNMLQTTAVPSSVPLFTLPVDIQLRSAAGDTTITIVNNQSSQLCHFTWSKAMTGMALDPDNWLVYALNSITKDPLLSTQQLSLPEIKLYPNPATNCWRADHVPANSSFTVTDITGRVLWSDNNESNSTVIIPGQQLATGMYLLRIMSSDKAVTTYKIVKE